MYSIISCPLLMKKNLLLLVLMTFMACFNRDEASEGLEGETIQISHPILGEWLRMGHSGPIRFNFKTNGEVEGDFGNDQKVNVIAKYRIQNDTIIFQDIKGQACSGYGHYKMYQTEYYLAFDLIQDDCSGRIKTTMGFWTKPNFKELESQLNEKMITSSDSEDFLNRGRLYMATGEVRKAQLDFDSYLERDSSMARVYVNRAGTRFPNDMEGVIKDCSKAIFLDSLNKNAYFLKGLALYELGEAEAACANFEKAISLGFSVLRMAEKEKCRAFWD